MAELTIVVCDDCGAECRDDPEDWHEIGWHEIGWRKNVDNDDFCPTCALKLDPPEDEENG